MTAMHTSNRSASTSPSAQWTLDATIRRSAPSSLLAAVVAAIIALSCTIDERVPLTTGVVLAALLPAVLVDLIDRRLPNRLVGAAGLVGVTTLAAEVLVTDLQVAPTDLLLGAAGMAGPLLVTHLVRPAAMGFGDVKLAVVAGAALGLVDPVLGLAALAIGSAAAALVGLTLCRRTVAFGPGLVGGAIVSIVLVVSPLDPLGLDERDHGAVATPIVVTPPRHHLPHSEGEQP
jgi:leader peptidase (prepilin peptidase)/N-methyltransferase